MTHPKISVASSLLFILAALAATAADPPSPCTTCDYHSRGDRFEGVRPHEVSAAGLSLIAVEFKAAKRVAAPSSPLYLHFWLPTPTDVNIQVWEPKTNYVMAPRQTHFSKGSQVYSWPSQEVVAPLGLQLDNLYPLITGPQGAPYYPALLSTSKDETRGQDYIFIFNSSAGVQLTCVISHDEHGELTPIKQFSADQNFARTFSVSWDGLDSRGKPVPSGPYYLQLTGNLFAATVAPVKLSIPFWHYGSPL